MAKTPTFGGIIREKPPTPALGGDEEALRGRIKARAAEQGLTVAELLAKAGVDKSNFYRRPARRITTLLKLAAACQWDLLQLLGIAAPASPIAADLLLLAYQGAEKYLGVPADAQTLETFIRVQAALYHHAAARRWRGAIVDKGILDEWNEMAGLMAIAFGIEPRPAG